MFTINLLLFMFISNGFGVFDRKFTSTLQNHKDRNEVSSDKFKSDISQKSQRFQNIKGYLIDNFLIENGTEFVLHLKNISVDALAECTPKKLHSKADLREIDISSITIKGAYDLTVDINGRLMKANGNAMINLKNYKTVIQVMKELKSKVKIYAGNFRSIKLTNLFDKVKILKLSVKEKFLTNSTFIIQNIKPVLDRKIVEVLVGSIC